MTRRQEFTDVAGVDPSLTSTGVVIIGSNPFNPITDAPLITPHRVRSKGKKTDTWLMRWDRIIELADQVVSLIPSRALVIIEAPAYASTSGSMFDRTCLWWEIVRRLDARGCTVFPVEPQARMRYATGAGGGPKAGKDLVLAAAIKRYPDVEVTGNDVADALLFAAIGRRLLRLPIDALPGANLADMTRLQPLFDAHVYA